MTDRVLVTGASGGQQGKTGRRISEILLARGIPVRAFVHRIDERSDQLRALGAEVIEGDLLDLRAVRQAARGASRIYFAYPVQEGLLDATAIMAAAAREAGVSHLVDMVMLQSSPDAPTPRMRQNYLSEQVFEWAGIGAVHVRATVFYENIRAFAIPTLGQGVIRLPWADDDTVVPLVAAEDVARVAAGLLTSPSLRTGAAYGVIGAVLTMRQIIATFSRVVGRDIRFQQISDGEWRRDALGAGINQHAVDHLSHLWQFLGESGRRGASPAYGVTDTIEKFAARRPKTLEEFLREAAGG